VVCCEDSNECSFFGKCEGIFWLAETSWEGQNSTVRLVDCFSSPVALVHCLYTGCLKNRTQLPLQPLYRKKTSQNSLAFFLKNILCVMSWNCVWCFIDLLFLVLTQLWVNSFRTNNTLDCVKDRLKDYEWSFSKCVMTNYHFLCAFLFCVDNTKKIKIMIKLVGNVHYVLLSDSLKIVSYCLIFNCPNERERERSLF
jgi:hypothetical protein